MPRSAILIGFIFLFWVFVTGFIPATVYWRDGGEFLLSGFFLDIPHPGGFPTYSQLSNLFALLPFGPAAWRVNAFATLLSVIHALVCGLIAHKVLREYFRLSRFDSLLLSFIPALILFASPSYVKQALTAEAYTLNALFIELIIYAYICFRTKPDLRFILLGSFLAGISLGNHVSIALFILPAMLIVLTDVWRMPKVLISAFLLGTLGLSIYAFIPLRSASSPPLNTGAPSSAVRFSRFITNARDRALRPEQSALAQAQGLPLRTSAWAHRLTKDKNTIRKEIHPALGILGLCGVLFLFGYSRKVAALFSFALVSNWYFFSGWDGDPWIPLIAFLAIGVSLFWAQFYKVLKIPSRWATALFSVFSLFVIGSFSYFDREPGINDFVPLSSFSLPANAVEMTLAPLPEKAVVLLEPSWFVAKYLQSVEGFRHDLTLVYQPQVLFPNYFAPVSLMNDKGDTYSSDPNQNPPDDRKAPSLEDFLRFVTSQQELYFEPNSGINAYFSQITRFEKGVLPKIERGLTAQVSSEYLTQEQARLQYYRTVLRDLPEALQKDTFNYLEAITTGKATLLSLMGKPENASKLLEDICDPVSDSPCSLVSLNNLALLWREMGFAYKSASLLLDIILEKRLHPAVVYNFQQTLGHLPREKAHQLKERLRAQVPDAVLSSFKNSGG